MGLGGFVAVQLQAERVEADSLDTLLHHLKGCHLLGDKEHSFALEQRIGDHVGDGL